MNNKLIQLNNLDNHIPAGYVSIKVLADQYGYAVNHVAWLARTKRVEAIQRGNKGQWLVQEASLKRYQSLASLAGIPSGHLPLKVLANKFGYAKNYLAQLAKAGKIEAVRDQRGLWYASEKSAEQYVLKAAAIREQKFSEHAASVPENLLSSLDAQQHASTVLFHNDRSSSADPDIQLRLAASQLEAEGQSKMIYGAEGLPKLNAVIGSLVIIGGVFVFSLFAPTQSTWLSARLPFTPFTSTELQQANIFNTLWDGFLSLFNINPIVPTPSVVVNHPVATPSPEIVYVPYPVSNTSVPTSIIPRQVTITQNISQEQIDSLRKEFASTSQLDLTSINKTLSDLTTSVGILQSITGGIAQAPILPGTQNPNNTLSFGPTNFGGSVSVLGDLSDTGNFTTKTLNVSGVTALGSDLSVGGNLTVSGSGTIGNQFSIVGSASLSGKLSLSKSPTIPHTGTWPSFSNPDEATVYINVLNPVADGNIFAYANNGSPKFLVDAEGDIYGNNLVLTGSTTTATQTVGDLNVEGTSQFGDAIGDKIKFVGTLESKTLSSVTFAIQASVSQTADLFRVQDVNTNPLFKISNLGNASLSANFELTGTASIGGNTTLAGMLISNSIGSNSFAGSLDVSKGLRSNYITATSGLLTNSIGQYNAGPLNINAFTLGGLVTGNNQSISGINQFTAVNGFFTNASVSNNFEIGNMASIGGNIITKGTLVSSGTGSNSFAGSLNLSKGFSFPNGKITASGNVGIRTTGPKSALEVVGALTVRGTTQSNPGEIWSDVSGTNYPQAKITFTRTDSPVNVDTAITFETMGNSVRAERMRIDTTGNVGIGTTAPLTKFEVIGTASASNLLTVGSLQVANAGATVSYSRFGTDTTSHSLSTGDLLLSNNFEVNGSAFFDSFASISSNLEVGGYASIGGNIFAYGNQSLAGNFTGSGTGSNSFAGSLDISKGLRASNFTQVGSAVNYFNGNVGIGTTSPNLGILDVHAAASNINIYSTTGTNPAYTRIQNGSGTMNIGLEGSAVSLMLGDTAYAGVINVQQAYPLQFGTDNTVRMTILPTTGNVGIGTTGPTYLLEVAGVASSRAATNFTSGNVFAWNTTPAGPSLVLESTAISSGTDTALPIFFRKNGVNRAMIVGESAGNNGQLSFWTETASDGTLNKRMTIDQTGNVGIGTTDPGTNLLNLKSNITGAGSGTLLINNSGTVSNEVGILFSNSSSNNSGSLPNGRIYGKFDSTTYISSRLTLQSLDSGGNLVDTLSVKNGNVGIGTTNPGALLTLGDTAGSHGYIRFQGQTIGVGNIYHDATYGLHMDTASNGLPIRIDGSALILGMNGNVGIGTTNPSSDTLQVAGSAGKTVGGTAWDSLSDIRLKNILGNVNGTALDTLSQLRPIKFEWNNLHQQLYGGSTDNMMYGFAAQEIMQVIPQFVQKSPDGYYWYNPSGFEAILTAGIQEQQGEIASQAQAFESLLGRVASLSQSIDSLSVLSSASMASIWTASGLSDRLVAILNGFGVIIEQGLVKVQTLIALLIKTDKLEVGSQSNPIGITVYDTASGQPYCLAITNGITVSTPGMCIMATPTPSVTPTPSPEISPTPEITPDNIASSSVQFSPSPTPEIISTPTPEPTPLNTPTPTPDLTPEPSPAP